jgi:hypothetical protein
MGASGRVSRGEVCAVIALIGLVGGKRLPVRRKKLRTMRTKGGRGPKGIGDAPENARDMRGKGPVGVECAP